MTKLIKELQALDEAKSPIHKFIIVDEDQWDDDEELSSMADIYSVAVEELAKFGVTDIEDLGGDERAIGGDEKLVEKFCNALQSGKIGKITGKGKIHNSDPDLGVEGVEGPKGVTLLFPPL